MNERALKTLEYDKVIEQLKKYAGSELGRGLCAKLEPQTDIATIRTLQKETADALARIYQKGSLSFNGVPDIRGALKLLEVGSALLAGELLKISSVLTATLRVKNYGNGAEKKTGRPLAGNVLQSADGKFPANAKTSVDGKTFLNGKTSAEGRNIEDNIENAENMEDTDSLSERFSLLSPLSSLNNEIQRCILSEEEIADDASPGLKSVRRAIKITNDKIRDELNSIVNSQDSRTMLQDGIVTMRNGRYCLPVKSEYKGQFNGLVHDQSAKGSTIFMEPASVVRLNNELSELMLKEAKEIEKILAELSAQAAVHVEELQYNINTLTELDFIFARATLAKVMKATEPVFNSRGYINIKKGRHPLIDAKSVVPIDIYLGDEFTLLVITGPNTGGKTVTLKTVGLFTLMGQAGLHIPAFDGSELAVFEEVFADIGDEQSIEQSLSTFSSHMTNTVRILKQADEKSLVLFDELGAGTDPTEGAALAMAILSDLHARGTRAVATTHYSELKIYALSTPGVSNACCEFDVETLRPTYRLLIGIPGKSNAFAISSKLGLSETIIEAAKEYIGSNEQSFEDVISGLEERRVAMEREQERINALKAEAETVNRRLTEKYERLDVARERILHEANEQARDILQQAKDYADETIKKFNKWGMSGSSREMEQERSALRDRLDEKDKSLGVRKKMKQAQGENHVLAVGDAVLVLSLNLEGTVLSAPNARGDLSVQMGAMQTQVNVKDVQWLAEGKKEEQEKKKAGGNQGKGSQNGMNQAGTGSSKTSHTGTGSAGTGRIKMDKTLSIHPELNLIGKRVDEALPELDKYLDDAYLSHLPQVTIIHGRGTGALKDAVHAHLKRTKYVKSYRLGAFGEGDRGVTIVEFK